MNDPQSRFAELVCPLTRLPLRQVPLQQAREAIAAGRPLTHRVATQHPAKPTGETSSVLLRSDEKAAYPIHQGMPILIGPEVLTSPDAPSRFDLESSHYAEAYSEAEFYNAEAIAQAEVMRSTGGVAEVDSESMQHLLRLSKLPKEDLAAFPEPIERWLSARMDLGSEADCFQHIGRVQDRDVLQIGGKGLAAIKFLLAGAAAGELLTPMIGEAVFATELAALFGVSERFRAVVAIAEEMPFGNESFDAAYAGGCVHHMTTKLAFPEIARILKTDGRFAAVEPWRAPFYGIGTRVLGKREPNAFCRPLTKERVSTLQDAFSQAQCIQHGTLTRYPMLAAEKFGARIPQDLAMKIGKVDDKVCNCVIGLRRLGSGVAIVATK